MLISHACMHARTHTLLSACGWLFVSHSLTALASQCLLFCSFVEDPHKRACSSWACRSTQVHVVPGEEAYTIPPLEACGYVARLPLQPDGRFLRGAHENSGVLALCCICAQRSRRTISKHTLFLRSVKAIERGVMPPLAAERSDTGKAHLA